MLSPLARGLSPLLGGLVTSPLRGPAEALSAQLRDAAPPVVREALPLLDQLAPLSLDLAAGRTDFSPAPGETRRLVGAHYSVARTLLVRFTDDSIDETPQLAGVLAGRAAQCEVTVSSLSGDHVRPLQQLLPPPPAEVLGAAQTGAQALDSLSALAGSLGAPGFALDVLKSGVRAGMQTLERAAPDGVQATEEDIKALVTSITAWMGSRPGEAAQ